VATSCHDKNETSSTDTFENWYSLSLEHDSIPGIGLLQAYTNQIKKSDEEVIVAVIDTPVDLEHPVFENRLWVNENEIPNNGIDDDNNGYVDDIHGGITAIDPCTL